MARPTKQTVDYFPHDTDASGRRTLTVLEHKYGNDGYTFWFKLLELLGKSPGHYFVFADDDSWEFLLAKTKIKDAQTARGILATLATLGAVDKELHDHKIIWSQNFVDGIADVYERRTAPLPQKPDWRVIEGKNKVSATDNPFSDNDNPQTKLNKTKLNKETTATFEEFKNQLRERFSDLDFEDELEKFNLYWSEGGRTLRRPKLALKNWMDKAREIKARGANHKTDPDKYIKGKYGHMVQR